MKHTNKSQSENPMTDMVRDFHKAFGHLYNEKPTAIPTGTALNRAVWTGEELIEFLYATVSGNEDKFKALVESFYEGLKKAEAKILENKPVIDDVLVSQADALIDIEYFNHGSFTILGVEPFNLFKIVQAANMGKLWEDGKPRFREEDGKIIKPPNWEKDFAPEAKLKLEIERQKLNWGGTKMLEMKVFRMNDCDWVAHYSEEQAKAFYSDFTGISMEDIEEEFDGEDTNGNMLVEAETVDKLDPEHKFRQVTDTRWGDCYHVPFHWVLKHQASRYPGMIASTEC